MSHTLTRAALLLAAALCIQQLRVVLPLPVILMTLLIGTGVNTVLILAAATTSRKACLVMNLALPCVAFLQGHIPLFMLPVIFAGNAVYTFGYVPEVPLRRSVLRAPVVKTAVMVCLLFLIGHAVMGMPGRALVRMAVPFGIVQWSVGTAGVLLSHTLLKRTGFCQKSDKKINKK